MRPPGTLGYVNTDPCYVPMDYILSETGEEILCDAGVVTVDDAIERFLEEIDYFEKKLKEIDTGVEEVMKIQMEDPLGSGGYMDILERLHFDRVCYEETLGLLRADLNEISGDRLQPWEVPWDG